MKNHQKIMHLKLCTSKFWRHMVYVYKHNNVNTGSSWTGREGWSARLLHVEVYVGRQRFKGSTVRALLKAGYETEPQTGRGICIHICIHYLHVFA